MISKHVKSLTPYGLFIRFLLLITVGILFLVKPTFLAKWWNTIITIILSINAIICFSMFIFKTSEKKPEELYSGILSVVGLVLILIFPNILTNGLAFIVGIWFLLIALTQYFYVIQLLWLKQKDILRFIILGTFSMLLALSLLVNLGYSQKTLYTISGIYLIAYSFWQLIDALAILMNRNIENSRFSHFKVRLPVLITALLPSLVLKNIKHKYYNLTQDIVITNVADANKHYTETLEIFFHLGENVAFGFGHVDVCYKNVVYSYGCYNKNSNKFKGIISDGIILTCEKNEYLNFCLGVEKKVIVGFTVGLTSKEADNLQENISNFLATICQHWQPEDASPFAPNSTFYRVVKGNYVFYNPVRTNCACVAEMLLTSTGLNILPSSGFVTPGSYYDFLEIELKDPTSNVIKQVIYGKKQRTNI